MMKSNAKRMAKNKKKGNTQPHTHKPPMVERMMMNIFNAVEEEEEEEEDEETGLQVCPPSEMLPEQYKH